MPYQYNFHVEDVTCEKCDVRVREALTGLPCALEVQLVRTPQDEAQVVLTASEAIPHPLIEQTIAQKSVGTTHQYRVRWEQA
jgi:hypothetical protein